MKKFLLSLLTISTALAQIAVPWTDVDKAGASLGDLATRSASDLTSGTLPAARLPAFTGDVTSTAGTASLTLAGSGVTAGTYSSVAVDTKGRVTSGSDPLAGIARAVKLGRNFVFLGDSKTWGLSGSETTTYPQILATLEGYAGRGNYYNLGAGGRTLEGNSGNNLVDNWTAGQNAAQYAGANTTYYIDIGSNDFFDVGTGATRYSSVADYCAHYAAFLTTVRATGARVLVCTIPPRDSVNNYPMSFAADRARRAINNWIRSKNGTLFDGVVDLDRHFPNPGNTTYWLDRVHFNLTGKTLWAKLTQAADLANGPLTTVDAPAPTLRTQGGWLSSTGVAALTVPNLPAAATFGTGDFTLALDVMPTGYPTPYSAGTYLLGATTYYGAEVALLGTGQVSLLKQGVGGGLISASVLPLNVWTHVAITSSSGVVTIALNGMPDATGSDTNNYTGPTGLIGGDFGGGYFAGRVRNVLIASRALTAAEVMEHAITGSVTNKTSVILALNSDKNTVAGSVLDDSGNARHTALTSGWVSSLGDATGVQAGSSPSFVGVTLTGGTLTGGSSGVSVVAGGTNQPVTLNTNGTGGVVLKTSATTPLTLQDISATTLATLARGTFGQAGNSLQWANSFGGYSWSVPTGAVHNFFVNGVETARIDGSALLAGTTSNDGSGKVISNGNVSVVQVGATLKVKSGTNGLAGTVTLSAGSATITSTAIDYNTVIVLTLKTASGTAAAPLVTAGSGSATIAGAPTDNGTYNWVGLKVN